MQAINISEFKTRCLAILDSISRTGERVTILKRGKPVAQVVPYTGSSDQHPQETLIGTVEVLGDLVSPVVVSSDWEAEKPAE